MQPLPRVQAQHRLLDYWLETVLAGPWARPARLAWSGQAAGGLVVLEAAVAPVLRPLAVVPELSLQVVLSFVPLALG